MNVGLITTGNLDMFRSLLLPEAISALESNEPLTTLGLSVKDTPIGALSGCLHSDCFEILSLYIDPEYRKRGGGRRLLDGLLQTLTGYTLRVEMRIPAAEREALGGFLDRCGFVLSDRPDPDRLTYVRRVAV